MVDASVTFLKKRDESSYFRRVALVQESHSHNHRRNRSVGYSAAVQGSPDSVKKILAAFTAHLFQGISAGALETSESRDAVIRAIVPCPFEDSSQNFPLMSDKRNSMLLRPIPLASEIC